MTTFTAMPKYDSYKSSGYEWIGDIPTSWDLTKLGACLTPVSTKNRADLPLLSITRELGVIERDTEDQDSNHNFIPDDLSGYKVIEAGQFGMNKMKAWQGSYGVSKYTGIVSPAYYVFKFEQDIDPDFFHWAIRSHLYISFFASASDGVRVGQWDLSKGRMKEIPFVFPVKKTQTAIANFLDEKTAQIDEAIAIKEKQIELLKERKQIIIQQAVTQGLDPTVPMKDSGVEWIGQIPAHWIVGKIGHYARVYNGSTPSREIKRYWDNGSIPWLSSGKVNDYIVNEPSELISESALKECSLRIFPKGSIIIGIVGQGKTRGTSALLNIDATINQNVAGIIPSGKLDSDFLHLFLINSYFEIRSLAQGSNQEALNANLVSSFKILIPTLEEQKNIVLYANKELKKVDSVIEIQINQMDTLKEYKTTLINSAVTGKIKVV